MSVNFNSDLAGKFQQWSSGYENLVKSANGEPVEDFQFADGLSNYRGDLLQFTKTVDYDTYDKNSDGKLDRQEFFNMAVAADEADEAEWNKYFEKYGAYSEIADTYKDIRSTYQQYDKDNDGVFTENEIMSMGIDANGDGKIDAGETIGQLYGKAIMGSIQDQDFDGEISADEVTVALEKEIFGFNNIDKAREISDRIDLIDDVDKVFKSEDLDGDDAVDIYERATMAYYTADLPIDYYLLSPQERANANIAEYIDGKINYENYNLISRITEGPLYDIIKQEGLDFIDYLRQKQI